MKTKTNLVSILVVVAFLPAMSLAQELKRSESLGLAGLRDVLKSVNAIEPEGNRLDPFDTKITCQDTRVADGKASEIRLQQHPSAKVPTKTALWGNWDKNYSVQFSKENPDAKIKYVVTQKTRGGKDALLQEGWLKPNQEVSVLGKKLPWLKCGTSNEFEGKSLSQEQWHSIGANIGLGLASMYIGKKMHQGPMSLDPNPREPLKVLEEQMSRPVVNAQAAD